MCWLCAAPSFCRLRWSLWGASFRSFVSFDGSSGRFLRCFFLRLFPRAVEYGSPRRVVRTSCSAFCNSANALACSRSARISLCNSFGSSSLSRGIRSQRLPIRIRGYIMVICHTTFRLGALRFSTSKSPRSLLNDSRRLWSFLSTLIGLIILSVRVALILVWGRKILRKIGCTRRPLSCETDSWILLGAPRKERIPTRRH
jgi:hypothetical protein